MLARYTHPTEERKQDALESFSVATHWSQRADTDDAGDSDVDDEMPITVDLSRVGVGGPHGTRTQTARFSN